MIPIEVKPLCRITNFEDNLDLFFLQKADTHSLPCFFFLYINQTEPKCMVVLKYRQHFEVLYPARTVLNELNSLIKDDLN